MLLPCNYTTCQQVITETRQDFYHICLVIIKSFPWTICTFSSLRMVYLEICAEDPQQTWNRLKTVQRKRHKNIFADVRVTVCISTVQILTSNIIGSRSSSCYLSKQWRQEQEIHWSTSDGERREWERVTSDRLRIRLHYVVAGSGYGAADWEARGCFITSPSLPSVATEDSG